MLTRIDRAADGLAVDLGLYALSAAFALLTAATATLPPHELWGRRATSWYLAAALISAVWLARWWRRGVSNAPAAQTTPSGQAASSSQAAPSSQAALSEVAAPSGPTAFSWQTVLTGRAVLAGVVAAGTGLAPLVTEAWQRAHGVPGRAQEEVVVVEHGGERLLHTGTPYLSHDAIAALPPDDRLLGYLPYQPGMALFGLPRAAFGAAWWTDARVWFALVTVAVLVAALVLLRRAGVAGTALVRGWQAVLVVPLGTLALAVGGDDLPVLALCLLALAYAATGRDLAAGVVVGIAGALKLFAWPVALVIVALALTRRRGGRTALAALGIPVLALIPPAVVNPDAAVENVLRFPLGRGLVTSPAASNLPGHLVALWLPAGNLIAAGLLVLAGLALAAWLWRRPVRDAGAAAAVCAVGLLAATLLLPSTRFGYLLYPLAFAVWVPALRPGAAPTPTPADPSERPAAHPADGAATAEHTLGA